MRLSLEKIITNEDTLNEPYENFNLVRHLETTYITRAQI